MPSVGRCHILHLGHWHPLLFSAIAVLFAYNLQLMPPVVRCHNIHLGHWNPFLFLAIAAPPAHDLCIMPPIVHCHNIHLRHWYLLLFLAIAAWPAHDLCILPPVVRYHYIYLGHWHLLLFLAIAWLAESDPDMILNLSCWCSHHFSANYQYISSSISSTFWIQYHKQQVSTLEMQHPLQVQLYGSDEPSGVQYSLRSHACFWIYPIQPFHMCNVGLEVDCFQIR